MNMHQTRTRHRIIETFAGAFALIESASGELATIWTSIGDAAWVLPQGSRHHPRLLPALARRLQRYFAGEAVDFDDVPTPQGSPFFERCWQACRLIPRGETRSYAQLAALAGSDPKAARAAGQAMRRNPLAVIVPCHRVVGAAGQLHGYRGNRDPASPQLAVKRALLCLEGAMGPENGQRTTSRPARRAVGASSRAAG